MRGAWVASVANMHWPAQAGLTGLRQREALRLMLDRLAEARFNAVFFQVRPEGDALYRSELEPWSRFLSGRQGQDPGYDPLDFLVSEAHRRGLEVHAWLNPYRAQATPPPPAGDLPVAPHQAAVEPESVLDYGLLRWMDPGSPSVRSRLVRVCQDLTGRYDLDGLHFDDYFYPYPEGELPFPDQASYARSGTSLSLGDWRRAQVNEAIQEVSSAVAAEKPYVRFGISPFGIPAPRKPEQISGLDQYEKLFADTQLWMDEGWVDYLAPQLYWPTTRPAQAYQPLLQWWREHAREGRYIFPGLNLAALGSQSEWTLDEYRRELALAENCGGYIIWNVAPILENRQNVKEELFAGPAVLTPPLARYAGRLAAPPELSQSGGRVRLTAVDAVPWRAFTVYRWSDGGWTLQQILRGHQVDLPAGRWALASVSRDGAESLGRVVTVP
ncbi:MAG: family 10 glycosylhydrolase [Candidatus Eremiobacteraeota bacterium]|nr:family 10 glycosylhydrolase [Candidatus Eremiobacteraeota bacterium]